MKKLIFTSVALVCIAIGSFSQDLKYNLHGAYQRAIKKGKLNNARLISDIIPDYPSNWVEQYDSVEIVVTNNGKTLKSKGKNNVLSTEQKDLLQTIDVSAYIAVNVYYRYNNILNNHVEFNKLNITFRVVPEIEATFVGGEQQLDNYIKEKGINKLTGKIPKQFQEVIVGFTVGENGEISEASILKTSGSEKVDRLLLDAVHQMPKWKPAENMNGKKVKQEFELSVNNGQVGGC